MIRFPVSACGARTTVIAGLGPRAFAMGCVPFEAVPLTTSEGTGATSFEVGMRKFGKYVGDPDCLWDQVERRGPDECWPFMGKARAYDGRGRVRWYNQFTAAPRVALALTIGLMPPSHWFACHTCNNPECCNPAHLYLGTLTDNNRYSVELGRSASQKKTHCPAGHPYVEGNVYMKAGRNGKRFRLCVTCENRRCRAKYPKSQKPVEFEEVVK